LWEIQIHRWNGRVTSVCKILRENMELRIWSFKIPTPTVNLNIKKRKEKENNNIHGLNHDMVTTIFREKRKLDAYLLLNKIFS
jgi:hypothetical protein